METVQKKRERYDKNDELLQKQPNKPTTKIFLLSSLQSLKDKLESNYPRYTGCFYWIVLAWLKTLIFMGIKLLTTISGTEAAYIRGFLCTIISYILIHISKVEIYPTNNPLGTKTILAVATMGSCSFLCIFIGLDFISLSKFVVLSQTSSLWNVILGYAYLSQKLAFKQILQCIFSFFGVILIINPAILSLPVDNPEKSTDTDPIDNNIYLGSFFGLLSGLMVSIKRVMTIDGMHSIHPQHNLFYFSLGGTIFAAFVNIVRGSNNQIGDSDVPIVMYITFFAQIAHWMLVPTMRLEPNATISGTLNNTSILWSFLIDIFVLNNSFNWYNAIGGIIIGVCAVLIIYFKKV